MKARAPEKSFDVTHVNVLESAVIKPLWSLVRLLKLPVASRGSLHVRRGVVLLDGVSISGKRKLGAVSTMPPTIQMSMRRDLLWIVHISVFSLGRIVDPWMCLVIHTVPFCLFYVSRTCTSRRAESNSATTERIFDSLAKFPCSSCSRPRTVPWFFFVLVNETTSLGESVFGLAGLLITFVTYILAVSTRLVDQVSLAFVFLKYVISDSFNYPMAPGPARGRGDVDGDVAPSLLSSLRRGPRLRPERRSTLCTAVPSVQSFLSLTNIVYGAAGHNRWGVVERRLPAKTQDRNVDGVRHRRFLS